MKNEFKPKSNLSFNDHCAVIINLKNTERGVLKYEKRSAGIGWLYIILGSSRDVVHAFNSCNDCGSIVDHSIFDIRI